MNNTIVRLSIAALAAAALAACGGGGSSSPISPVKSNSGSGNSGSTASFASGTTKLTLTIPIHKGASKPGTLSLKRKTSAALHMSAHANAVYTLLTTRKSPKYLSDDAAAVQVTVQSGSTSSTYNIDLYALEDNANVCAQATQYTYTCTINIPTIGATENILALELDSEPTGTPDPVSGISTGDFPVGTAELANGSTSATLTPGGITNIALSLNPVIAQTYDCGDIDGVNGQPSVGDDPGFDGSNVSRIVFAGGAATRGTDYPLIGDYDFYAPQPVLNPAGNIVGQPFVDLNGLSTAVTATSSSSAVTVLALTGASQIPAPATGSYSSVATFPDSSYVMPYSFFCCNESTLQMAFKYDGSGTPSASYLGTITLANNLTAAPPLFAGQPPYTRCCGEVDPSTLSSYAWSSTGNPPIIWNLAAIWATVPSNTVSASTGTITVTGYDPGSINNMDPANCEDSSNTVQATVSSNGSIANGVQMFTLTPSGGSAGTTCTFTLRDDWTGVQTTPVTINITT